MSRSVSIVTAIVLAAAAAAVTTPSAAAATKPAAATNAAATNAAACVMTSTGGRPALNAAGATVGNVDVLDSSAQVLPTRTVSGAPGATLCSARDAYASMQIEVSANHGIALRNVSMAASDLVGPAGATLSGTAAGASSDVRFSREDYVTLGRLSDGELDPAAGSADKVTPAASRVSRNETTGACTDTADACRFPDVLIPDRDALTGQVRNAFNGLTIPSGENRVIWTDVFVPATAAAGAYTGTITVTQTTGAATVLPVQLTVAPVTLPATSTTDSTFFYNAQSANGGTDYQKAAELGLDDRISVVPQGPISDSASTVQNIMAPLLDGTDPHVQLADANGRAALTDLPMNASSDGGYLTTYKSLFTAATKTKPWAYCDEWDYDYCAAGYAASAGAHWPGLPLLAISAALPFTGTGHPWADPENQVVPAQLTPMAGAVVDLVQYLDPTYNGWLPGQYNRDLGDRSAPLRAWAKGAAGRQAWAYTSNSSGNTGSYSTNPVYTGFPSLGIDQVASEQQAMGWTMFNDGLNGQLYWTVDRPASQSIDAAKSGLSGDGTLFYPYNAAQVGGSTSIPLESIRLKRIRNGQQDNELLTLATRQARTLADGRTPTSIARALFPSVSSSAVTPAALDAAEQDLIRLFPAPSTPAPATTVNPHDLDCNGTPDFLAVSAYSGDLLFYPRTRTDWAPNAPVTVGHGFGTGAATTYTDLLLPGDVNGDGAPDLVGRKADGSMWLMPGDCSGSFGNAVGLGLTTTHPVTVGDFSGDGRPDLLDRHTDGTVWLLAGTGSGFTSRGQVGAGWGSLQMTGAGDLDGDRAADVVGRNSGGQVLVYEGSGTGGWKTVYSGVASGLTLTTTAYPHLFAVGDLTNDGNADLVAVGSDGTMWTFAGNGAGGFSTTPTRIGGGWTPQNLVQIAQ